MRLTSVFQQPSVPESSPVDDTLLFGHDPTPGLVALHPVPHASDTAPATMRLYQRDLTTAALQTQDVPWYPFFFLTDMRLLHGFPRARWRYKPLHGDNPYRYLVVCNTWQDYRDAMH